MYVSVIKIMFILYIGWTKSLSKRHNIWVLLVNGSSDLVFYLIMISWSFPFFKIIDYFAPEWRIFYQTLYLGSILNKVSTFFVEIKMSQYPIMNWSNIRGYDFLADWNAHCYFVKDHTAERSNCICNLYWCEPWLHN